MIDAVVTGAGGFIGKKLVEKLQATGAQVLPLTSRDGDVAEAATWAALPPARVLVHLAGRSYVPDSWQDGAGFIRTNVLGTEQALAYCRREGAAMVLASAYVYGIPQRLPIVEEDAPHPNNPYALSKLMAEQLCEFASRYQGVPVTALRIFNVFGAGQRKEFLIPSIIEQVKSSGEIRLLDLTPRRDYIDADDVVEALALAMNTRPGFTRINIGSGISYSVGEIVDIVQSVAGTSLPVVSATTARPQEIPDVQANITRARQLLGWHPQCSFQDGIRKMFFGS